MAVAAYLRGPARSDETSGGQPVTTAAETVMMSRRSTRRLSGRGEHEMRAHREGVGWCMCGRGHCVLGRGGIPGGTGFEAYTVRTGRKGMYGQRMPRVVMGWRGVACMMGTHEVPGMGWHLR